MMSSSVFDPPFEWSDAPPRDPSLDGPVEVSAADQWATHTSWIGGPWTAALHEDDALRLASRRGIEYDLFAFPGSSECRSVDEEAGDVSWTSGDLELPAEAADDAPWTNDTAAATPAELRSQPIIDAESTVDQPTAFAVQLQQHQSSMRAPTTSEEGRRLSREESRPPKRPMPEEFTHESTMPAAATAAPPMVTHDPLIQSHIDAISGELYSRSLLAVSQQLGIRDCILRLHEIITLSSPLETLLEWQSQVHLMCLQIADRFTPEDFVEFLIGGLSDAQLNSSSWLTSPLAAWVRFSTRPLHYVVQTNTMAIDAHVNELPADRQLSADPTLAVMQIELLPNGHYAYQRWKESLRDRLRNQQQLQNTRASMMMAEDMRVTPQAPSPTPSSPVATPSAEFSSVSSDASLESIVSSADQLVANFCLLGLGSTLAGTPSVAGDHDRVLSVHAKWCPRSKQGDSPRAHVKRTRTHSAASDEDAVRAAHVTCECASSTPLPVRIFVNESFERVSGWRRIDVERGMQEEGLRWIRRTLPPSYWTRMHIRQLMQLQPTAELLLGADRVREIPDFSRMAAEAALASSRAPAVAAPALMTRLGAMVPAQAKCVHLRGADGKRNASVFIAWRVKSDTSSATPTHKHHHHHHAKQADSNSGRVAPTDTDQPPAAAERPVHPSTVARASPTISAIPALGFFHTFGATPAIPIRSVGVATAAVPLRNRPGSGGN